MDGIFFTMDADRDSFNGNWQSVFHEETLYILKRPRRRPPDLDKIVGDCRSVADADGNMIVETIST